MSFSESLSDIVAENRNQLLGKHPSWERVLLSDVATILNGFPFASDHFSHTGPGTPLIRIRDILRNATETFFTGELNPAFLIRQGDLLVGMDGDFNSSIWKGENGLLNQRCCKITVDIRYFDKRLLAYCLPGYLSAINAHTSSITVKHLSSSTVAEIPLPLPPIAEQTRIADTIDELFSDLDAGVAALERVGKKLKLYRAAVLKAAVEGTLTVEWRQQHPYIESASALLRRILSEHRRRWGKEQLRKFKEKGKEPPTNWKAKYKEPVTPDTTTLPPLPEGWCWVAVDQVCSEVRNGYSLKPDATKGTPILRICSVRPLALDLNDVRYLSGSAEKYAEFFVQYGDILFTRYNGTPSLVAVCAVVPEISINLVHPDKLIRGRVLAPFVSPHFVAIAANVGQSRSFLAKRIRTTAGQAGVSGGDIKETPIPLAPLKEQAAIVEAVENQLSIIDHLETELDAKLKSAQALRQAILRRAFTGQLVPQDPNDEPASELLKRIAAEQESRARETAGAKRVNKKNFGPRGARRGRPKKTQTKDV